MKKAEKMSRKYSKMSFEDFWKEFEDLVNKKRREKYDKKTKFKKFFSDRDNSLLKIPYVKSIAERFFERGRLQMVSEINMRSYY